MKRLTPEAMCVKNARRMFMPKVVGWRVHMDAVYQITSCDYIALFRMTRSCNRTSLYVVRCMTRWSQAKWATVPAGGLTMIYRSGRVNPIAKALLQTSRVEPLFPVNCHGTTERRIKTMQIKVEGKSKT